MIREQAITKQFRVSRMGELIAFQVTLPRDTRRIIGLEYEARIVIGEYIPYVSREPFDLEGDPYFKRTKNKLIGRLSLRNDGCEGLFFQGDLIDDRNKAQHEGIHGLLFSPEPWVQSRKREEFGFSVSEGLIEGFFEDGLYGQYEYNGMQYDLYLYLWIEKCAK